MAEFSVFFIAVGALTAQYFFSTRNNIYWGAIIPGAYIIFLTWMFVTNRIESTTAFILILIIGILFLIEGWHKGRKDLQDKRKKELDKMTTYDMR